MERIGSKKKQDMRKEAIEKIQAMKSLFLRASSQPRGIKEMSTKKQEIDREQWFADYEELTQPERSVLQFLSVCYEPVSLTFITMCFRSHKLPRRIRSTSRQHTSFTLKKLEKKGFVTHSSNKYSCPASCMEDLTLRAQWDGQLQHFVDAMEANQYYRQHGRYSRYSRYSLSYEERLQEWRIAVYQEDWAKASSQHISMKNYNTKEYATRNPFALMFRNTYDVNWFLNLPDDFVIYGMQEALHYSFLHLAPSDELLWWFELYINQKPEIITQEIRLLLCQQWILQGYISESLELVETLQGSESQALQASIALLQGRHTQAIEDFAQALATLQQETGKKKVFFENLSGIFMVLAWLKQEDESSRHQAQRWISYAKSNAQDWLRPVYEQLQSMMDLQQGKLARPELLVQELFAKAPVHPWELLFRWLIVYWVAPQVAPPRKMELVELYQRSFEAGYHWIAAETSEILSRWDESSKSQYYKELSPQMWRDIGGQSLIPLFTPKPVWTHPLQALSMLGQKNKALDELDDAHKEERLVWFVVEDGDDRFSLEARVQKWSVQGYWTKGRKIAPLRLKYNDELSSCQTPQDKQIIGILCHSGDGSSTGRYHKDTAFQYLIDHPLVFWKAQPRIHVDVMRREPVLRVAKQEEQLWLQLDPVFPSGATVLVQRHSSTRLYVFETTSDHQKLAEILGDDGLKVPLEAKQQVLDVMGSVAPLVTIHSDIGGSSSDVEEIAPDSRLYLDLLPFGEGLRVELSVRPLSEQGPRMVPAKGTASVFAQMDERSFHTQRDLEQEQLQVEQLLAASPTLSQHSSEQGEWLLEQVDSCLEMLLELQTLGDEIVIRWPEGERFQIRKQVNHSQMSWDISGDSDWFEADGKLQVDDDLVLELQSLLQLMELSPSRFLQLDDGQFVALTEEFRQRLDNFRAFSSSNGTPGQFHASTTFAMEGVFEGSTLESNEHWQEHCERLHNTHHKDFTVPDELQATLREYQIEGYQWLSRLAHWRFGACLADEMGLGKTLQALALLLQRAADGPALVIAPTSVCLNWVAETERFSPTLNVKSFGAGDRQDLLDSLEAYDVVVCSYGLLQHEAEMLTAVPWYTIILDEAQAIKNTLTKRSKAAMRLMGDFKLITTGTPIENHLGEFWNLFRFINPGLLGSWSQFQSTFAQPIEKFQDAQARQQLQKLIQPFILRRRKQDVLKELPPRTETVLHVEMSRKEVALYEALRQQALEKLTEQESGKEGQQHLQILAELMRLRRACCHPQLVMPQSKIPSSKLEMLSELLEELLANQHKVLVFSQFVGHLSLIRTRLEELGITYQYLDGSTPMRKRKERIDSFQKGQGDVFLISLKAGGFGINLTAADYVIHMDPWWNPAVEDQASDRAHRIGQQKPVTVYRLVTQHTIEEKIIQLHHKKRDLAESLLDGSDMTGKMSASELMALIQNT